MANEKNPKQGKHGSRSVTSLQFFAIILITVALAVVLDFGHRAAVNAELKREARRLESQVATLEAENHALEAQQEWVQTDDYVEEWARTEGEMVLRGETPVVPVPTGQIPPGDNVTPEASSDLVTSRSNGTLSGASGGAEDMSSHWPEWWALFFGPEDETTISAP